MTTPSHTPVLLREVLSALNPQRGQTYLDCTAGLAGHAAAIAPLLGPTGTAILCDVDPANLAHAAARLRSLPDPPGVVELRGNFVDAPRRLAELGLRADLLLADLGFSSNQMFDPSRGLSFSADGPLDMRLDPASPTTAADLVNTLPESELVRIIRDFGEEPAARAIARKLVAERAAAPISNTFRLAAIIRSAVAQSPGRRPRVGTRIDPATRTFQALRIAVNDELGCLGALLESVERAAAQMRSAGTRAGFQWLAPGARLAFISFHSLEDRLVKQSFGELLARGLAAEITRKPIEPGEDEVRANPRSRSARLRWARLAGDFPADL